MDVMKHSQPLVSVIIPVNKDHPFLEDAIISIKNQQYKNIELLIVANGCSDEFFLSLQNHVDLTTKIIRTNIRHVVFARNLAIHHSLGDYIAIMDSDDISDPCRISEQLNFFYERPDTTIVGSNVFYIDEHGAVNGQSSYPLESEEILKALPNWNCLAHSTIMAKKDFFERMGGYMYGIFGEDYDLWLRAKNDSCIIRNIEKCLVSYRVHTSQASSQKNRETNIAYDLSLRFRDFLIKGNIKLILPILKAVIKKIISFPNRINY